MKSRFYLVAIAVFAFSVAAFGQHIDTGSTIFGQHVGANSDITSRSYTSAVLLDANGNTVGKVKTATVVSTSRGTIEGLRVQLRGLTAGSAYAVVIDGTLVGQATADANGSVTFKFISPSNGRAPAIPDAIRPIAGAHNVQVYEASSQRLVGSGALKQGSK